MKIIPLFGAFLAISVPVAMAQMDDSSSPSPSPSASASPSPSKHKHSHSKAASSPDAALAAMTPAPGGGPGLVWVNTSSHVYHKEGSKYYGKTKHGKYMAEADAIKEGDHAAKETP